MRCSITYDISNENAGRIAYDAKIFDGISPPYQSALGLYRMKQTFSFSTEKQLDDFMQKAREDFGTDFHVTDITYQ